MAVIGTFGSFTAARLGIYASQSSLNVTGNNIANINTKGYTRQRMDLVSLHSSGNARYHNGYNLDIGYGVLADGVSQLRDPFLDIRFRNENSSVGSFEARLEGLDQISQILDEVGQGQGDFGVLEDQFNDLIAQLNDRNYQPGSDDFDTLVRSSAESLTNFFNQYADSLSVVKDNLTQDLREDVDAVNTILHQIRDLNVQIRDAGIYGDKALELRDARNVLIDDLSSYIKIDVRYDMEKIDEFTSVERINISIADSGTPPIKLLQGIYGTQIEMAERTAMRNPDYNAELPTSNRYISAESTPPANIRFTNNEREAMRDGNGKLVINDGTGDTFLKANGYPGGLLQAEMYDPNLSTSGKYLILDADGNVTGTTDDPEAATQVDNAVKGSDENRLWMSLQPLTDEHGNYMRDQYHQEIKETVDLSDTQLYGSLQAKRELLTEEGEFSSSEDIQFDENANIKRGIRYYQHALDSLAQQFAKAFNEANRLNFDQVSEAYKMNAAGEFVDKDGNTITDSDGNPIVGTYFDDLAKQIADAANPDLNPPVDPPTEEEIQQAYDKMEALRTKGGQLTDRWSFYKGGVMFSNKGDGNDPTGITAANITIAKDWSTGAVRTLHTKKADDLDHSTAEDNIYHMVSLMGQKLSYLAGTTVPDADKGDTAFFKGTFQEMLANINLTLAMDERTTGGEYNSYTKKALSLENSRQSVSGVDLNDEATNMMMFQKSYSAACQLMTTLDSMLDKLINGTIR